LKPPAWPRRRIGALKRLSSRVPGKARLARAMLRRVEATEDVVVEGPDGARFFVPHLADPIGFHLLVDGQYERETAEFILGRLSPGDVFVDVGANIGVFTVPAASRVGPRGRVLAVEPSPPVFSYLRRNIRLNRLGNVLALAVAASDDNRAEVPFYAAPAEKFGMGALAPQFDQPPCTVSTRTLDALVADAGIDRVAVLKVDVEGHELGVFRGCRMLLERSSGPAVVFEFCDWAERRFPGAPGEAQEFLSSLGYRIWRLRNRSRGAPPLPSPLRSGSAMLVALRD
jgi:FkbM family methyltransferase